MEISKSPAFTKRIHILFDTRKDFMILFKEKFVKQLKDGFIYYKILMVKHFC